MFGTEKYTWLIPASLYTLAFQNELEYRNADARVNSGNDAATSCEHLVNFGPV